MRTIHLTTALVLAKNKLWQPRRILDLIWVIMMGFALVYGISLYRSGWLCAYMGTDFRGYYASAQIAWERGFADVYDPHVQSEYQASLYHQCPEPKIPQPIPKVSMPYLPVFVLVFLPLLLFDFTTSYLFWIFLNLVVLVIYLIYFSRTLGEQINSFKLIQWVVCVPVISNFFLGQMNVWLVVCLGEFYLLFRKGRRVGGGVWLGGMLLKPQTLVLLLPGLVLSQNWGVVLGFILSLCIMLGISFLLAGFHGLEANVLLICQFAGPLIKTASSMMNYRALAIFLGNHLPELSAWAVAFSGAALVVIFVIKQWLGRDGRTGLQAGYMFLATCAGTLAITWHSHFYLLMILIPILIFLDIKRVLPLSVLSIWLFSPFVLYWLISVLMPDLTRNLFGLGMLALSQFLIAWAAWRLSKDRWIQNYTQVDQEWR